MMALFILLNAYLLESYFLWFHVCTPTVFWFVLAWHLSLPTPLFSAFSCGFKCPSCKLLVAGVCLSSSVSRSLIGAQGIFIQYDKEVWLCSFHNYSMFIFFNFAVYLFYSIELYKTTIFVGQKSWPWATSYGKPTTFLFSLSFRKMSFIEYFHLVIWKFYVFPIP